MGIERTIAFADSSRRQRQHGGICMNAAPTFTCSNYALWILGNNHPYVDYPGRWLTYKERVKMSGLKWQQIMKSLNKSSIQKACGDCMPVDMVGCVLGRVFEVFYNYEKAIEELPPPRSPIVTSRIDALRLASRKRRTSKGPETQTVMQDRQPKAFKKSPGDTSAKDLQEAIITEVAQGPKEANDAKTIVKSEKKTIKECFVTDATHHDSGMVVSTQVSRTVTYYGDEVPLLPLQTYQWHPHGLTVR